MKAYTTLLFLSLWLIAAGLEAQSVIPWKYYPMVNWDTSPYKPYRFMSANNSRNMNFRLLFPTNYDSTTAGEKYPIILVLHGAGESALRNWGSGNQLYPAGDPRIENNDHQLLWGGREHLSAVNSGKFNGFVLFPQNFHGTWVDGKGEATSSYHIDLQNAVEMLEYLITQLKIDPNRIYVWGLSNGGGASWYVAYKRPDLFAGTLPMSGPGDPAMANILVEQPVWVFQGQTDTNPRPMFTKETISAIENAGGLPRYTEYANTGHNTWTKAYNEPDFFSWMLSKNKLQIHAYYGKTEFPSGSTFTTTLGVSQGFAGYEWRHNGSIINGANAHKITISQYGDYQVRVKRGSTWTEWSPIKKITSDGVLTAPAAPSNLQATAASASSINLSWSDNSNNEDNFRVYRSGSSAGTYSLIATLGTGTSSYSNSGLSEGTQYFYQVEAVNAAGSSARSNTASATTTTTLTAPAAPSNLQATAASASSINLSWSDNSNNEDNFRVYRSGSSAGTYSLIATLAAGTSSYSNTGLSEGTQYFYQVEAVNAAGASARSNTASATTTTTLTAPAAPSNLQAIAASSSSINLSWSDNSNNEDNFRIYRSGSSTGTYSLIATLGAGTNSYSNTGLSGGTQYFYQVEAVNAAGSSARSNTASATTTTVLTAPAAPSNLQATAASASSINLSWSDNSNNEDNFRVYRSGSSAGTYSLIATLAAGTSSYSNTGLSEGTQYFYQVEAVNAAGTSARSNTASATTESMPEVFNAPSNLTAQWTSNSEVNLSWQDNSADEQGFVLERANKPDFKGSVTYINITSPATTYQDQIQNTKKGGGEFYYRIKAIKTGVSSDYSNITSPSQATSSKTARVMDKQYLELQESFVVFPNPFSEYATIQFNLPDEGTYSLSLYDSKGVLVSLLAQGSAEAGVLQTYKLEGDQLLPGIYLVLLQTEEWNKTIKVLHNK